MLPFRKILFPVDYSDSSCALVPYVREMVNHYNAELTLLHAYSPDYLAYTRLAPKYMDLGTTSDTFEKERIEEFARDAFPQRHVETMAILGEPGAVIQNAVKHHGTDLVMLPTHGRGLVRRALLGSVTTKVLHDVDAAVWTVTHAGLGRNPENGHYKSVLCAIDQSDSAEAVLKAAVSLATGFRAQLRIVHAIEVPPPTTEVDFSPYRKLMEDEADFRLRELKGSLQIDAPHSVEEGPAAVALHDEAIRRKVDLIVTGRGHSQDIFAGILSRLYSVIREAPCPVLSI